MKLSNNEMISLGIITLSLFTGGISMAGGYLKGVEHRDSLQRKRIDDLTSRINQIETLAITNAPKNQKETLKCMNINAFHEAGNYKKNGGFDAKTTGADILAISSVVLNRSKTDNKTPCETVASKCGNSVCFSWLLEPKKFPIDVSILKKKNPIKWELVTKVNEALLSGQLKKVEKIHSYANPQAASNQWHWEMVKNGKFVPWGAIGDHVYYVSKKDQSVVSMNLTKEVGS